MDRFKVLFLALVLGTCALTACGDDDSGPNPNGADAAAGLSVYEVIGEEPGLNAAVDLFLSKVLADNRVNGYFLNQGVGAQLGGCFVKLIGSMIGGPQKYDCGDPDILEDDGIHANIAALHEGLGISQNDFNAVAEDLTLALREALKLPDKQEPAYVNAIVDVVGSFAPDVIEDSGNNDTIYQRLGQTKRDGKAVSGKGALIEVIDGAVAKIAANVEINGFFGNPARIPRLKTCLVRQLCEATGGPCKFGEEVTSPAEPGVADDDVCQTNMATLHAPLRDGANNPIDKTDFDALVADVGSALDDFAGATPPGTFAADKATIVGVLNDLCSQIVTGGTGCP